MSMTREAKQQVERFLQKGEKIGAIKHLRDTYGFSLEQSKILVEAMEGKVSADNPYVKSGAATLDEHSISHISGLLKAGKKIEAVKFAKDSLKIRLKAAKKIVEDLDRSLHPSRKMSMTQGPGLIILLVFGSVGLVFLAVAGYLFHSQNLSIENSDLVTGRVIRMVTKPDGMSAPVIAYDWNGQEWLHASTTYSSPPAYSVDEAVPIYVNRENAADIVVDTFTDRWFLITIFAWMGLVFTGIPVLVARFGGSRQRHVNTITR